MERGKGESGARVKQDFHFVDSAKEIFFLFVMEAKDALMKINIVLIMIDIFLQSLYSFLRFIHQW